jgi:hypothetical protein
MSNITEVQAAIATITEALERNAKEHDKYRSELAAHEQSLAAEEVVLREHALAAKRGDESAQQQVDRAISGMRDSEAAHRLLIAALLDLENEAKEFQGQLKVASENQLRAKRADVAEQKLALARELDAEGVALADKMVAFAKLHVQEGVLSQQLGEPEGRVFPFAWPLLFANLFWRVWPGGFDLVAPDMRPIATFQALATRTAEEVAQ